MAPALDTTKQRLLFAAEEIFAEKGFEATSIRDICKKAEANIAAVNYHFGDKNRLYIETVEFAHTCVNSDVPWPELPPAMPALERLHAFIQTMIRRMVAEERPTSTQLMMRELSKPTQACEEVVRDYIRPMADQLRSIVRELLPAHTPDEVTFMMGFSIVGQILFYKQNRPIVQMLAGEAHAGSFDVDRLTDHIFRFALGGMGLTAPTRTEVPA